jgi:ribosome-associated protein
MTQTQLKKYIIQLLEDKKAENIVTMDIRKLTDFEDFMIICSGTSTRHVSSLTEHLIEELKKHNFRALGHEGKGQSEWSLVDFGDIVVQVMLPQTREFYALEKLWSIAKNPAKKRVTKPITKKPAPKKKPAAKKVKIKK